MAVPFPQRLRRLAFASAFLVVAGFGFLASAAPAMADTSDNVSGWAWSGTIGWISLNCTNEGSCATSNYGVTITDDATTPGYADVSGWAWSATMGWICFGATCSSTTPEGGASYASFRPSYDGRTDQFFGWAQIIALGDKGWISLNCDNLAACGSSNYHLVLDTTTGAWTQGSASDHWGWNGNSDGTGIGWVDFSLVNTTWTPADLGVIHRPQGIYEPADPGLPGTHLSTFTIGFTGFSASKDYQLQCTVTTSDGSQRVLSKDITSTVRGGTASVDYTITNSDAVDPQKLWIIDGCRLGGPLSSTACTSDTQCPSNDYCDTTGGFCRRIAAEKNGKRPIFTHGNTWTGLGANQDQYLAIKCNAAFPGNYFNNAAKCDFTGDASFSLAMRRGMPVEGNCTDGIDNDGNGQIDCADRYCQGISYLCHTLPRTTCIWGQANDGMMDCSDPAYTTGGLCCTEQPVSPSQPTIDHVVNGLECTHGDPNDGYFDCDCNSQAAFDASTTDDCFAPGHQAGDLCCDTNNEVVKQ